jgi:hypothetical protein
MIIAVLDYCGTHPSPSDAGRLRSQFTNLTFWSTVEYPNEQVVSEGAGPSFFSTSTIKLAYVVEGGNKLLIHFRPHTSIWVGECQNPHLTAL